MKEDLLKETQESLVTKVSELEVGSEQQLKAAQTATEIAKQREMLSKINIERAKFVATSITSVVGLSTMAVFEAKGTIPLSETFKSFFKRVAGSIGKFV